MLEKLQLTKKWVNREVRDRHSVITNFEYLMHLNTLAGRSFNDVTQYPVFPWVIQDYTSKELDLTKTATFRDLSKPMGALTQPRLAKITERYESFDDPVIPKFHHGTHYSSAAIASHHLLRLEPFASLAVAMQGKKLDYPGRLLSRRLEGRVTFACMCSPPSPQASDYLVRLEPFTSLAVSLQGGKLDHPDWLFRDSYLLHATCFHLPLPPPHHSNPPSPLPPPPPQASHYLVRLEPFTSLAASLQGGKLDHPDRLFRDVASTWRGVTTDMADVKELVREKRGGEGMTEER
ncbi:unnamed protein product [Closterium sp. NIES-64]|nr:unnamed protein product [Closterium sp. NIES-64]